MESINFCFGRCPIESGYQGMFGGGGRRGRLRTKVVHKVKM